MRYRTAAIEELVALGGGESGHGGGQEVLTRDQHDAGGPLVPGRITRTYRRTAYVLRRLALRDADGHEQTLRVTEEHPFYLQPTGWTPARLLRTGDTIHGADGVLTVVANASEAHPAGVTVYNLEVAGAHTYFVLAADAAGAAGAAGADAAWVHNATYDTQGRAVVRLSREPAMSRTGATQKASALSELSMRGMLVKAAEPVARNRSLTAAFRQDTIDRIWAQYGSRNRAFAEALIDRVTTKLSPDHRWDLQLGGPDIRSNLRWLDRPTNELFGSQVRRQLVGVPTGTQVRIEMDGF